MYRPSDMCDPLEGWKEKVDYALEVALSVKSKVEVFEPYAILFIGLLEDFIDDLNDLKEQVDLNIIDIATLEGRVEAIDETLVTIGTTLSVLREDIDANADVIEAIEGDISDIQTTLGNKVTANADIIGATKTKITYDNKGLVTAGADLTDTDIPSLATSKITGLDTTLTNINTAIGNKVTANTAISGGTKTKITYDSKGLVTAGADLTATDIPNLATSKITSGTFADARIPALAISKITGLQTALDSKLNTTLKGAVNGLAELDANGKVPSSQLPSYVDDVLEFANKASFPSTGEAGKIYIAMNDNKTYRWSGSTYVEISPSLALGETSATAYRGDRGATAFAHVSKTDNPHGVTKTQVGLGNVANVLQYSASNAPPYPVTSVAGKTGAVTLAEADIPALSAGKITSGTFADARIPSLNASKTTSGIFSVNRIPTLATSKISGLDTTLSGINTALDAKQATITGAATTIAFNNLAINRVLYSNGSGKVSASNVTSAELLNLSGVTSKIQTQLDGKQAKLTFDNTPTDGSANPVTSGGVYDALDAKQDTINVTPVRALVSNAIGQVQALGTVTATELGYVDGVTSPIQTQLDGKQDTITGGASTIVSNNLPVNRVLASDANGKVTTSHIAPDRLLYLNGVTSNIQAQLNGKQNTFSLYEHTIRVLGTQAEDVVRFSLTVLNQSATPFTLESLRDYIGSSADDYKQCSGVVFWDSSGVWQEVIAVSGGGLTEFILEVVNPTIGEIYWLPFSWTEGFYMQLTDKVRQIV